MAANPPSPTQPASTPVAGSLPPAPTPTQSKEKDKEKDKDAESSGTPKWLSPGLLLLDLYEKLSIATKRRAAVSKVGQVYFLPNIMFVSPEGEMDLKEISQNSDC